MVKSVYHVAREWIIPKALDASSSLACTPVGSLWDKLLKACISSKVKMATWQILSNIIPSGANLHKRHLMVEPSCTLCGAELESTTHLVLECPLAKCVWLSSSLDVYASLGYRGLLLEWALHLSQVVRKANVDGCLIAIRAIWMARNEKFWGTDSNSIPGVITRRAMDWWQDFLRICHKPVFVSNQLGCQH